MSCLFGCVALLDLICQNVLAVTRLEGFLPTTFTYSLLFKLITNKSENSEYLAGLKSISLNLFSWLGFGSG
jgi:hypothetical protein